MVLAAKKAFAKARLTEALKHQLTKKRNQLLSRLQGAQGSDREFLKSELEDFRKRLAALSMN